MHKMQALIYKQTKLLQLGEFISPFEASVLASPGSRSHPSLKQHFRFDGTVNAVAPG